MAFELLNIIFNAVNGKWIGGIRLDAMIEENHNRTAEITDFPLEDGESFSDHIILKPKELSIQALAGSASMSILDIIEKALNPAGNVFNQLNNLMDQKAMVTVITGLKVYQNMGITEFTVQRDKMTGGALLFNMSFKQMKVVNSTLVNLANSQVQDGELQPQQNINTGKVSSGQNLSLLQQGSIGNQAGASYFNNFVGK